jgi:hypothetical protein
MVVVDVFPPHHMTYLRRHSVAHSGNTCLILVVDPVLRPSPSSDLRTRSDLTVDAPDVVENIVGGTVLVVLEDGQHVSRL